MSRKMPIFTANTTPVEDSGVWMDDADDFNANSMVSGGRPAKKPAITPETKITITIDGEDLLTEFLNVNSFTNEENDEIISSLATKGKYVGGGGASPIWTIKLVE